MLIRKPFHRTLLLGALCTVVGCADSPTTVNRTETTTDRDGNVTTMKPVVPDDSSTTTTDRTNTAVNERDRLEDTKTPLDQNENSTDIDMTAAIRKKVVATQMSVDAQNVKIITQNGKVTLRGPVPTAEEKTKIEEIAMSIAGNDNVDSQLEVESN